MGPRVNAEIQVPEVQLIDHEGENHGIVPIEEARNIADEAGLDLVEISPTSKPPVCKILDYGRFKYLSQKKASEARKKQKTVDVKEIKMRPNIDRHDYDVKKRSMTRFLEEGDKVKVTMRFRGREMAHQELGLEVLHKVRDELADRSKVEFEPKLEGRQMTMILSPLPAKTGGGKAKPQAQQGQAAAAAAQETAPAPDQAASEEKPEEKFEETGESAAEAAPAVSGEA